MFSMSADCTYSSFCGIRGTVDQSFSLLFIEPLLLLMCPQAILHASLDRNTLSVEKFARWLRAICTMLLARNTAPDRLKAISYIEQAIVVLEEHGGDSDDEEVITPLPPEQ
jgi:hypothetical protein